MFSLSLVLFITLLHCSLCDISKVSDEEAALIRNECTVSTISKRSIAGTIAANHQFKHVVRVMALEHEKQFLACSGVLISSKHVLSAAHCFHGLIWGGRKMVCDRKQKYELDQKLLREKKPLVGHAFVNEHFNISVQYGARCILLNKNYGDCDAAHTHREVRVKQVVIHPMYLYDFCYSGDLAILELESPITMSNEHDRLLKHNETTVADFGCLPTADLEVEGDLTMAGFGVDPRNEDRKGQSVVQKWLKFINVSVAESCLGFIENNAYQPIDGLCTQSTHGVPCQGDSAGPLVLPLNGQKDTIVAVHSEAFNCKGSKKFLESTFFPIFLMIANYPQFEPSTVYWAKAIVYNRNKDPQLQLRLNKHTDLRYHVRWICGVTGICTDEYAEEDLFEKPVVLF